MNWQPIESAPLNVQIVMARFDSESALRTIGHFFQWECMPKPLPTNWVGAPPTHWLPLPEPPK